MDENTIMLAILGYCEDLGSMEKPQFNGHHLAQRLTAALVADRMVTDRYDEYVREYDAPHRVYLRAAAFNVLQDEGFQLQQRYGIDGRAFACDLASILAYSHALACQVDRDRRALLPGRLKPRDRVRVKADPVGETFNDPEADYTGRVLDFDDGNVIVRLDRPILYGKPPKPTTDFSLQATSLERIKEG